MYWFLGGGVRGAVLVVVVFFDVVLLCYNPLSGQKINFRIHTTPKGIVTKVEREKKIKGKIIWEELKIPVTK